MYLTIGDMKTTENLADSECEMMERWTVRRQQKVDREKAVRTYKLRKLLDTILQQK